MNMKNVTTYLVAEYRTMLISAHYSLLSKATERMEKDFLRKSYSQEQRDIYLRQFSIPN